jgi:hypothetical protein
MSQPAVSRAIQKACIWAGPAMGVLFVVGFVIASFSRRRHRISPRLRSPP